MAEERSEDEPKPIEELTALMGLFAPPPNAKSIAEGFVKEDSQVVITASTSQDEDHHDEADAPNTIYSYSKDAPAGSTNHLMNLFAPINSSKPTTMPSSSFPRPIFDRQSTAQRSNISREQSLEDTPLIESSIAPRYSQESASSWNDTLYASFSDETQIRITESPRSMHSRMPSPAMPPIQEVENQYLEGTAKQRSRRFFAGLSKANQSSRRCFAGLISEATKTSTIIGSFMYLLYHIVFCLAFASAIIRPNNPTSILGLMTKTAALGTIAASPAYWYALSSEVPALYPTVDLFLAPFLANLAVIVDQTLADDVNVPESENDTIFLATFGVLSAIGICFSGLLVGLASAFKLANLGSFLPFSVICGFFSAVGVLMWTLAVTVDTGGTSISKIILSGDMEVVSNALLHHIPGVVIAAAMKYLGPKNPSYVIVVSVVSIGLFYAIMFAMGLSLEEAKEQGWFWTHEELVYQAAEVVPIGFYRWAPPAPFGLLHEIANGMVHWGAVYKGLSTTIATGFLYLIRCSVHGTALKKNIPNLSRKAKQSDSSLSSLKPIPSLPLPKPVRSRKFSEAVDIEADMHHHAATKGSDVNSNKVVTAKPTNITLKEILLPYGYSQFISALVGGFAVTPAIAASSMMFTLGAENTSPQIGSVLLLLVFYLTDFQLVGYIPKPAFSSLLILSFIDMMYTWFYKSYFKTKDKVEWLVVPLIVIAAFALDLLTAVFLGIAISTFIFVAAFFRSGVVKYVANGIVIHSTVERPFRRSEWLNENGDLIQVLVLQNYLFFGNSSSVYHYIEVLFQGENKDDESRKGKRLPLFLILDLTLVTGMDTSTVDIFNDIKNLCASNKCKVLMAGMSRSIRTIFSLGGFIADTSGERSKRLLRFFQSLDAALGKAEDNLLDAEFDEKEAAGQFNRMRLLSEGGNGFRTALRHIDEEHDENFSLELLPLQAYTSLVELKPGDGLYGSQGSQGNPERGLFFIECGVMKVERETDDTITRGSLRRSGSSNTFGANTYNDYMFGANTYNDSLTRIQASSLAMYSSPSNTDGSCQTFRLARIGPGWVAGTLEYVAGMRHSGHHVAITDCRLHHLPYSRLQEIEKSNPSLVLSLYKLLSYLMARRQEATIGQLATLHSIMTSPAKMH